MAKKSFKLVKASAALAVTAAALTPVMAAEASTAKAVELKAEVVLGGKFKEALALNTPAGVQITWGKHLVTAINKWQTVTGKGSDGKTYIKKLYARNYPLYVLDQDLGEVEAGSELVKPSIRVMYRDGKIYTQAPERYTMSSNYNTKDEGEQKVLISYNHNGNRITKLLTYTVVAGEVEFANVASSVDQAAEVLSVTADVKNLKEGEKVELVVYPGKDTSATPIKETATVKEGKLSVSKKLPAGTHSFQLVSGDVKTAITEFTVDAPALKSVEAKNGKDLVLTFNKPLDELTAENKANYELKINNASALAAGNYTVELDENDKTKVHVTLADSSKLANGSYVTVKASKEILTSELKKQADDVTKAFTFVDLSAPKVTKVEKVGNNVKVTFDDYVSAVGLVKVNGVVKDKTVASPFSKEVIITNGALNLGNGTYTVELANVSDIASVVNTTSFATGSFTITDDTVAPVISKVEKTADNKFKIEFNKDVTAPTVSVTKNGFALNQSVSKIDNRTYEVTVSNNGGVTLYNSGETTVALSVAISGYKAVSNNIVGDASVQSVTLSKDTTAPSIVSRFNEIKAEAFEIHFDETLKSADETKIVLTDKNGVRKSVASATIVNNASGEAKVLRVESTDILEAGVIVEGKYTLALSKGAVKDLADNESAATTVEFTKSVQSATEIAVSATAANNVITIPYGVAMTNSAINLANYKLDNKALPAGSVIYFSGNKATVVIELPAGSIERTQAAVFSIDSAVTSEAGAKVNAASSNQIIASGLVDNVRPTLTSAKKINETTIELTFSENLGSVEDVLNNRNDFVVKVNGVTFNTSAIVDGTSGDNKVRLTVPAYNVAQTVTVATATADLNVADVQGNLIVGGSSVTATN